jgi:hypothetical protein
MSRIWWWEQYGFSSRADFSRPKPFSAQKIGRLEVDPTRVTEPLHHGIGRMSRVRSAPDSEGLASLGAVGQWVRSARGRSGFVWRVAGLASFGARRGPSSFVRHDADRIPSVGVRDSWLSKSLAARGLLFTIERGSARVPRFPQRGRAVSFSPCIGEGDWLRGLPKLKARFQSQRGCCRARPGPGTERHPARNAVTDPIDLGFGHRLIHRLDPSRAPRGWSRGRATPAQSRPGPADLRRQNR